MPTIEAKCPHETECQKCGAIWAPEITECGDCPDCGAREDPEVFCRVCLERPSSFALCDESAQEVSGQGFCRECAPAQVPEANESDFAEIARYSSIFKTPTPLDIIESAPSPFDAWTVAAREAWHFELCNAATEIADLFDLEAECLAARDALVAESGASELSLQLYDQAHLCHIQRGALLNRFGAALEREAVYARENACLPSSLPNGNKAPKPAEITAVPAKSSATPAHGGASTAEPMTEKQKAAMRKMGEVAFGKVCLDSDLDAMARNVADKPFDELNKSEASRMFDRLQKLCYPGQANPVKKRRPQPFIGYKNYTVR